MDVFTTTTFEAAIVIQCKKVIQRRNLLENLNLSAFNCPIKDEQQDITQIFVDEEAFLFVERWRKGLIGESRIRWSNLER